MDAKKKAKNSEQSDENKQLAARKLHNVRVSTNGARSRAPVGARLCRFEARATLHTLTSVNQRLTPQKKSISPEFHPATKPLTVEPVDSGNEIGLAYR